MHPFIKITESFSIPTFGLMMMCGMILAFVFIMLNRKYQPYDDDDLSSMAIVTILSGFAGSKLMYWMVEMDEIIKNPKFLLQSLTAGFVFYGALIGGAIGMYIYAKVKKRKFLAYVDLVVPAFMAGQGLGRIGCFLAGCCYGKLTDSAIGVTFPAGVAAAGTRIPVQLMESAFCLICAVLLAYTMRKEKKYGFTAAMYFILYGIWRFFIEFFRDDERGAVGMLSTSQFIGIFIVLAGICVLAAYKKGLTPEKELFSGNEDNVYKNVDNSTENDELSTENVDKQEEKVENVDENVNDEE